MVAPQEGQGKEERKASTKKELDFASSDQSEHF
jgi:hypothetical protein